jgi:hypothetical protein
MVAMGIVFTLGGAFSQSNQSSAVPSSETNVKPLLLERDEGELRTRRIHTDASVPASSQFILKVSPKNNGSEHCGKNQDGSKQTN